MGTQVKVADAARQQQCRPFMDVALKLLPPRSPEVKCVCPALFPAAAASRTSSSLCGGALVPTLGGGEVEDGGGGGV